MNSFNVLKESLKNTYIVCNNKDDWLKLILILVRYLPSHIYSYGWFISDSDSNFQYINISSTLNCGYGSSDSFSKYTQNHTQILLSTILNNY